MLNKLLNKIEKLDKSLVEDCGISLDHVFVHLDDSVEEDSYRIDITEKHILFYAKEEKDLFYGLLTLLQQVKTREILLIGNNKTVVNERGVHVDCGRKFYSKEFFLNLIDQMALNKLNILQMHFSEILGYRLESKVYPDITSEEHLTFDDVKEIIAHAQDHYIEVIPSLDSPGHLDHVVSVYPEHRFPNLVGGLNITSEASRDFIKVLYDEVLELFGHTNKIHMGADEFLDFYHYDQYPELEAYAREHFADDAHGLDTYVDYINDVGSYLMSKGKEVRIWNDGFYRTNVDHKVELNPDLVVTYWTNWHEHMAPVDTFMKKGHKVINFDDANLYYVVGETPQYKYPSAAKIKENFEAFKFPTRIPEANDYVAKHKDQVKGAYLSIWSDFPEKQTETEVYNNVKELLVEYGLKFWEFEQEKR